jgi:aminopeptidase
MSSLNGFDAIVVGATQPSQFKEDSGEVPAVSLLPSSLGQTDAILNQLKASRFTAAKGEVRTLYGVPGCPDIVAVVGLGKPGKDPIENARVAAANGISAVKALQKKPFKIALDSMGSARGASEGTHLGQYTFDQLKSEKSRKIPAEVTLVGLGSEEWNVGKIYADAQNLARRLAETPANLMTPTIFCKEAQVALDGIQNLTVKVHEKAWAENLKMDSFLSVAQGSDQPPKFLEMIYKGGNGPQYALVGKGVTFDTGGISIKPSASMDEMRADMMGMSKSMS